MPPKTQCPDIGKVSYSEIILSKDFFNVFVARVLLLKLLLLFAGQRTIFIYACFNFLLSALGQRTIPFTCKMLAIFSVILKSFISAPSDSACTTEQLTVNSKVVTAIMIFFILSPIR
ncbi:hypothetical protein HA44_03170 [Mixta gaviniae]|nr:hypothetical protein HA44_03170 [Mixta gaviniae]